MSKVTHIRFTPDTPCKPYTRMYRGGESPLKFKPVSRLDFLIRCYKDMPRLKHE